MVGSASLGRRLGQGLWGGAGMGKEPGMAVHAWRCQGGGAPRGEEAGSSLKGCLGSQGHRPGHSWRGAAGPPCPLLSAVAVPSALREGRRGFLQVDGEEVVSGESPGKSVMVNTEGLVYLGEPSDRQGLLLWPRGLQAQAGGRQPEGPHGAGEGAWPEEGVVRSGGAVGRGRRAAPPLACPRSPQEERHTSRPSRQGSSSPASPAASRTWCC